MEASRAARAMVTQAADALGWSPSELARRVGDLGGQIPRWLTGSREHCSLNLRLRVVDELKLPLSPVLTPQETDLVRMGARALRRERESLKRGNGKAAA